MCARHACRSEVCERSVCAKVVCVCVKESCVKVLWVKEWCGTGVGVKVLRVQARVKLIMCVKEVCGTEVYEKVLCKNVLCVKVATPATQSEGRCRQVPRLPKKVELRHREPSAPPEPAQCHKCHACFAKCTWMSPSTTPAMTSAGRCRQVPRLPHKAAASPGTKRATRASPVP